MKRIEWTDLPVPLKEAVEERTGPITDARTVRAGLNSPLAAIVETETGTVFVKGLPADEERVKGQAREIAVAPLVTETSPGLLWHFDQAGWNVLGFEYIDGAPADYRPGSPDLDQVVGLMDTLSRIEVPANPGLFKRAEQRWASYVDDPADAHMFAGQTLAHTDWLPDNVLISGDRAWLVDFAWPTLAADWLDAACWLVHLIARGHRAYAAEAVAARLPAYAAADPRHVDLFAQALARMWKGIAADEGGAWAELTAIAAAEWHSFRQAKAERESARQ